MVLLKKKKKKEKSNLVDREGKKFLENLFDAYKKLIKFKRKTQSLFSIAFIHQIRIRINTNEELKSVEIFSNTFFGLFL